MKCVSVMLFTDQQYVRLHDGHYNLYTMHAYITLISELMTNFL